MSQRIILIPLLAGALLGAVAGIAWAWDATCSSGEACVWKHAGFVVPLAAKASGDADYGNDKYPNTQEGMNDSVSSIRNRFGQKDVVWFFNANYSGTSFCLNAGYQVGDLRGHNDEYSSHLIAVSTTCS